MLNGRHSKKGEKEEWRKDKRQTLFPSLSMFQFIIVLFIDLILGENRILDSKYDLFYSSESSGGRQVAAKGGELSGDEWGRDGREHCSYQ